MSGWDRLREAGKTSGRNVALPSGIDLMRRINEGGILKAPTEYLQKVKSEVTDACDELLDFGARIRPLVVDKVQVGWVRGLHASERRVLNRWVYNPNDFVLQALALTTSFTPEEIETFNSLEIKNLVELVKKMSEYDFSLYPYLSAFATTMTSENLWHGKGQKLTSFENRVIEMPDGKKMRIMAPPDHARLWATLCTYREQAKKRLDDNFNAVLIIRPWAGKNADPLAAELKTLSRQMQPDSLEPWESLVRVESDRDLNDGWAHPENLDTREGMLKELHGMLQGDKHEQLMEQFEKQQIAEAEAHRQRLEKAILNRGGVGINEETIVVESEEEVRQRERELKKGRITPPVATRDTEVALDPRDKIKRYRS